MGYLKSPLSYKSIGQHRTAFRNNYDGFFKTLSTVGSMLVATAITSILAFHSMILVFLYPDKQMFNYEFPILMIGSAILVVNCFIFEFLKTRLMAAWPSRLKKDQDYRTRGGYIVRCKGFEKVNGVKLAKFYVRSENPEISNTTDALTDDELEVIKASGGFHVVNYHPRTTISEYHNSNYYYTNLKGEYYPVETYKGNSLRYIFRLLSISEKE